MIDQQVLAETTGKPVTQRLASQEGAQQLDYSLTENIPRECCQPCHRGQSESETFWTLQLACVSADLFEAGETERMGAGEHPTIAQ